MPECFPDNWNDAQEVTRLNDAVFSRLIEMSRADTSAIFEEVTMMPDGFIAPNLAKNFITSSNKAPNAKQFSCIVQRPGDVARSYVDVTMPIEGSIDDSEIWAQISITTGDIYPKNGMRSGNRTAEYQIGEAGTISVLDTDTWRLTNVHELSELDATLQNTFE